MAASRRTGVLLDTGGRELKAFKVQGLGVRFEVGSGPRVKDRKQHEHSLPVGFKKR
jgi:hypothetical protein